MGVAWLYGVLLWAFFFTVALSIVYGAAYLYKLSTSQKLQHKRGIFVSLIIVVSLVIAALGIYFSKKFGIYNEFKMIAQIIGLLIGATLIIRYLLKRNKQQ